MSAAGAKSSAAPYRTTSLDFINRPNPIEPHAQQQKHPLNHLPLHESVRSDTLHNHDSSTLRPDPSTSLWSPEHASLDLPRLPVKPSTKRLRIPPTLSGLHHPPPNAGLLPSINVEQPLVRESDRERSSVLAKPASTVQSTALSESHDADAPHARTHKLKRNKWSDTETDFLLKGVDRFGIGSWTKILNYSDYHFNQRTAVDLKDRFRTCCPDHYATRPAAIPVKGKTSKAKGLSKGPIPDRITSTKLHQLGITAPFAKSNRRLRHGYTAEEDDAILRGFKQYGTAWASIRQDASLGLAHRTPTDLRDRFRTRYPQEYAKLATATRKASRPSTDNRGTPSRKQQSDSQHSAKVADPQQIDNGRAHHTVPHPTEPAPSVAIGAKKTSHPPPPPPPDDFLVDFDIENLPDLDDEPIVLDRGILDWPSTDVPSRIAVPPDFSRLGGIDPRVTIKLPGLGSYGNNNMIGSNGSNRGAATFVTGAPRPLQHAAPVSHGGATNTSLPSLSTLLPIGEEVHHEDFETLNLPLLQSTGAADGDYNTQAASISHDELMG